MVASLPLITTPAPGLGEIRVASLVRGAPLECSRMDDPRGLNPLSNKLLRKISKP